MTVRLATCLDEERPERQPAASSRIDSWPIRLSFLICSNSSTLDSFECAVHRLAPVCEHCGCRIIGHGVEADGRFFCCAHCAQSSGSDKANELRDAVGTASHLSRRRPCRGSAASPASATERRSDGIAAEVPAVDSRRGPCHAGRYWSTSWSFGYIAGPAIPTVRRHVRYWRFA